jgi:hypothetical protein
MAELVDFKSAYRPFRDGAAEQRPGQGEDN